MFIRDGASGLTIQRRPSFTSIVEVIQLYVYMELLLVSDHIFIHIIYKGFIYTLPLHFPSLMWLIK